MDPLGFASAGPGEEQTRTVAGRFEAGAPDWAYVPVRVPAGVREIAVRDTYDRPEPPAGQPGNALDLGAFDEDGVRGWAGGGPGALPVTPSRAPPPRPPR